MANEKSTVLTLRKKPRKEEESLRQELGKQASRRGAKRRGKGFRKDYKKLATLIERERKGKLSALFACNAIPIKVGERFCNLRLVTLFD